MIKRLEGTAETRTLIRNIVEGLQKEKSRNRGSVEYVIDVEDLKDRFLKSELLTREDNGSLRNVSLLYVDWVENPFRSIEAAIGNTTGNIVIHRNNSNIPNENMVSEIMKLLKRLQPKNLSQLKQVTPPPRWEIVAGGDFTDFRINKFIGSSDGYSPGESYDLYKTL